MAYPMLLFWLMPDDFTSQRDKSFPLRLNLNHYLNLPTKRDINKVSIIDMKSQHFDWGLCTRKLTPKQDWEFFLLFYLPIRIFNSLRGKALLN